MIIDHKSEIRYILKIVGNNRGVILDSEYLALCPKYHDLNPIITIFTV